MGHLGCLRELLEHVWANGKSFEGGGNGLFPLSVGEGTPLQKGGRFLRLVGGADAEVLAMGSGPFRHCFP
jgi:hypothetical protein